MRRRFRLNHSRVYHWLKTGDTIFPTSTARFRRNTISILSVARTHAALSHHFFALRAAHTHGPTASVFVHHIGYYCYCYPQKVVGRAAAHVYSMCREWMSTLFESFCDSLLALIWRWKPVCSPVRAIQQLVGNFWFIIIRLFVSYKYKHQFAFVIISDGVQRTHELQKAIHEKSSVLNWSMMIRLFNWYDNVMRIQRTGLNTKRNETGNRNIHESQ